MNETQTKLFRSVVACALKDVQVIRGVTRRICNVYYDAMDDNFYTSYNDILPLEPWQELVCGIAYKVNAPTPDSEDWPKYVDAITDKWYSVASMSVEMAMDALPELKVYTVTLDASIVYTVAVEARSREQAKLEALTHAIPTQDDGNYDVEVYDIKEGLDD